MFRSIVFVTMAALGTDSVAATAFRSASAATKAREKNILEANLVHGVQIPEFVFV